MQVLDDDNFSSFDDDGLNFYCIVVIKTSTNSRIINHFRDTTRHRFDSNYS